MNSLRQNCGIVYKKEAIKHDCFIQKNNGWLVTIIIQIGLEVSLLIDTNSKLF